VRSLLAFLHGGVLSGREVGVLVLVLRLVAVQMPNAKYPMQRVLSEALDRIQGFRGSL
jgi:hypothetical protein